MKVKVYSTNTCPYCHMAKEFLSENKIEFDDINVQEDPKAGQEMVQKSGQMGVPVIEIDDNIIVGFDKDKIKELLKI
jgi:glutaredoxin 3